MKIFKLRDIKKRYYREAIRAFIDTADIKDIDSLCRAVEFNKSLTMEEYGAIYYAVAHMRQRYLTAEPRVVVATMDAINAGAVDKFEDTLKSKQYEELLTDLYITLALSLPNGELYCKGDLRFTEGQYEERRNEIMRQITELAPVASKILGVELKPVQHL